MLAEFNKKFKFVTLHEDRLVCDRYVYSLKDFKLLQDMEIKHLTSAAAMTPLLLIHTEGMARLHRLTVNRWYPENQEYYMQVRGDVVDATCLHFFYVEKMFKNTFISAQNEFFMVLEEMKSAAAERTLMKRGGGISGSSRLMRIQVDCLNIKDSGKFEIKLPKEKILQFKQYTADDFVVLQKTQYLVGKCVGDTNVNSRQYAKSHYKGGNSGWMRGFETKLTAIIMKTIELDSITNFSGVCFLKGFRDRMPMCLVSGTTPYNFN